MPLHHLLTPGRLADHLCIPVIPLSSFIVEEPDAVRFFQNPGEAMFSGATVFREYRRTVVFNDTHLPGRQANDIVHELGHGLLLHPPTVALDERGCRQWDRDIEAEADWLSGVLLVPDEAALLIVRRGWSIAEAATKYGVLRRDDPMAPQRNGRSESGCSGCVQSGSPTGFLMGTRSNSPIRKGGRERAGRSHRLISGLGSR